MSDNPNFVATMSTDEIYYAQDLLTCLTDVIDDKAEADHNHNGVYATESHTHTGFASQSDLELLEDVVDTKANATHTHSEYAPLSHTHDNYATVTALDTLESEVDGKSDTNHTHSNYAPLSHTHNEYASTNHDHDEDYAAINHTHTDYATTSALNEVSTAVSGKANASHTHAISDVSNLQSTLDGKASSSHGTHVTYSTTAPVMDGTASVGTASTVSRSDHKHPTDTSRASQTEFDTHVSDTTKHITSTERTNWGTAYTHSQSSHAPSNAEVNQNAFSNVKIGTATIAADTKTDTLTLIAGNNITITPDTTEDSVTISATDTNTTYSAGTGISLSGTTFNNSGVRSISTGSSNGTISVNTNGTSANVAVKGLGSAAYTASNDYDAAGTAQTKADAALVSARAYADGIKNDLLNGAGTAYDTLKELGDLIDVNADAIDALETVAASKANASDLTSHTSNKSNPHNVTLAQLGVTATASELNKMDGVTATTSEINIMDGVTATTAEINYLDGVTSNVQTQLDGKAASSHGTHVTYSTNAPKANGTAAAGTATTVSRSDHVHPAQTTVSGNAGTATKLATARTISLTGDVTGSASFDGSANASITATVADDSHNHVISNVDGLQSALNGKASTSHTHTNYADISHKHYPEGISATGKNLNNYIDAGIYTFTDGSAPTNVPAGTNGWLVVIPWVEGSNTVKQIWFRHGTVNTNDFETYVRTKVGTASWGSWSKYYTTSNPPTYADVGASPAFTSASGDVKISVNTSDNKNLLDKIDELSTGVYTIYSQSGVSGNPKSTEAWRLLVHKTSDTIGWVMAFGSSGSVYANYQNEADHFQGWRCIYDATNSNILWTGAYYMSSPNNTPQTVTPSKKLSECRTGWLLLWSDYDANTSTANDTDFCTTYIPKYNPSGGTWSGKAFYCDVPIYAGGDETDLSTERRCIKLVYVYDNCIKGNYQNNQGGRNDAVLRAVYEV